MSYPTLEQTPPLKILLVDDEPDILTFMRYNLVREGYEVFTAQNGAEAVQVALSQIPQLIVLDLMMPEMDGLQTYRVMRQNEVLKDSSIIFLTARSEDFMQIAALDMGADDYITKPVKPNVFVSKIKSLLRRQHMPVSDKDDNKIIKVADLEINRETFVVKKNLEAIELPRKEFNIIFLLASKPGKVFTREDILSAIWGNDVIVTERTIDVHIRKLREKLGEDYIKTIKGVGYKFID